MPAEWRDRRNAEFMRPDRDEDGNFISTKPPEPPEPPTSSPYWNGSGILDAYALEPGKAYALRMTGNPSPEAMRRVADILVKEEKRIGCRFLLLTEGIEFVPLPPDVSDAQSDVSDPT